MKLRLPTVRRPRAWSLFIGPSAYLLLLTLVGVLTLIGLVMVLSASQVQSLEETGSPWSYFVRHLAYVVLGIGCMLVTLRIDYRRWRRFALPMVGVCWLALVVVLVPGVGVEANGARSWIGVGTLTFQPSELVKATLLIFSADLLARRSRKVHDSRATLRPVLVVLAVTVGLVMFQPDLGSTLIIAGIVVSVLFLAGVPLRSLGAVLGVGTVATLVLALRTPYRRDRLLAFLHPSEDPLGVGYHINQSLTGVATGGVLGAGLGESRAKYGFLPNSHTDFIFAIISEELGLLGALTVVACFGAFALLGIKVAVAAPDRFGTLVAGGVTAWVMVQAFVNIGGVIGILPITGVTLPFISYGGTSLLILMASAGILLNVARQGRAPTRPSLRPTSREAARSS